MPVLCKKILDRSFYRPSGAGRCAGRRLPRVSLRCTLGYFRILPTGGLSIWEDCPSRRNAHLGGMPIREGCPRWLDLRLSRREAARIAQGGVRFSGRNPGSASPPTPTAPEGRSNHRTAIAVGYGLTRRTHIVPRCFIVSSPPRSAAESSCLKFKRAYGPA
jgi:hypothetical protein